MQRRPRRRRPPLVQHPGDGSHRRDGGATQQGIGAGHARQQRLGCAGSDIQAVAISVAPGAERPAELHAFAVAVTLPVALTIAVPVPFAVSCGSAAANRW